MVWPNYISEGKIQDMVPNAGAIALLKLLAARLERLSVDSLWARRASGARGSLLKALEADAAGEQIPPEQLEMLIEKSFNLLERAAREIPDLDSLRRGQRDPRRGSD